MGGRTTEMAQKKKSQAMPPDQDQRDLIFNTGVDKRVLAMGCCQDQAIHMPGIHRIENRAFVFPAIVGIGQYSDISFLVQRTLNTPDDRRENWVGKVRNQYTNRLL